MKKGFYILWIAMIALVSCKDDDINVFEKTADERTAEAIATLKADLVAPANGWRLKYRPQPEMGSFYVLLDFREDNTVTIKSDLGVNNGEYFEQTITYRIDSSLGLELIMENYCFFSFLFELEDATFGSEFEFNFVNKTPDDALVFSSKTDIGNKTILVFEEASASDEALLGYTLAENLNIIAGDLDNFTPSFKLTYTDKNVLMYLSMDDLRRTISFTTGARKTAPTVTMAINFDTPYVIKGDSIVFDSPLTTTIFGTTVSIKGIKFNALANGAINVCVSPIPTHIYSGITSASDLVTLEPSLVDGNGKSFATRTTLYTAGIYNVLHNGVNAGNDIAADLVGAGQFQIYYNYNLNGAPFYAIGFYIDNGPADPSFFLREFTPTLNGNNLVINFTGDMANLGNPDTQADIDNANKYVEGLAEGGTAYVFQLNENFYEFYNPCSGWTFILQAAD